MTDQTGMEPIGDQSTKETNHEEISDESGIITGRVLIVFSRPKPRRVFLSDPTTLRERDGDGDRT